MNHWRECLPKVPWWTAAKDVDILMYIMNKLKYNFEYESYEMHCNFHLWDYLKVSVNRSYGDIDLLGCLIPVHPKGEEHIDERRIRDNLPPTAGDLHTAKEAKVDPFPYPGASVY